MQEHIIFGAGLIGGFLYGVLASQGKSAAMVARPNIRDKLSGGMKLSGYQGHQVEVKSPQFVEMASSKSGVSEPHHLTNKSESCDFLWLTVKCTGIVRALSELADLVDDNTVILCCQNGLGSDAPLREAFPHNRILRVMVGFNVSDLSEGRLHRGSEGQLIIESGIDEVDRLIKAANSPLLPMCGTDNIQATLWAKLQLNLANPVNALADIPVKEMLSQREFRRCFALLMAELLAVVSAKNISLPKVTTLPASALPKFLSIPNWLFRIVGNQMLAIDPTVRASMWWDLHTGRRTEIDYLNGAVVSEAKTLGIETPANRRIVELIHAVERGVGKTGICGAELYRELSHA